MQNPISHRRYMSALRQTGLAVCLSSLMLAATGTGAEAKNFRFAFQGDAQTMDPHGLFETFTLGFQRNFYEGLVIRNNKMELSPALALSWENTEPNVWRFKLRKGVKFHGGEDFTAEDVKFSVERTRTEGSDLKTIANKISDVRIIDDHTVELVTPAPDPILPFQLEIFYIMDKGWAEKNSATEATNVKDDTKSNHANLNANGTGPFRLVSREPGVKTVLERFDGWWGSMDSNITQAVFTPIAQDATRVAALISGELDLAWPVPVQDWTRLENASGVRPLTGPEARTIFLGFDQDRDELLYSSVKGKNPFKDVRVRKAFAHAINIDAIRDKVMRGAATPSALMVAPQINGFVSSINDQRWKFDTDAANRLMKEAGYGGGFSVTMDCPNDRYVNDERICQAVTSMLSKINVKVDLLAQTKSKYFGKVLAQNNYDTSFFLLGWTPSTFDSHNPISSLMSCRKEKQGLFNLGGYCNERVFELGKKIQSETDPNKRNAMIREAFQLHFDEVGHIPLHQQPLSWGASDGVKVFQRPDNAFDLRHTVVTR